MATDRRLDPETHVSSPRPTTKTGGPVRELVEALTAIGNYLAVANRILLTGQRRRLNLFAMSWIKAWGNTNALRMQRAT